MIMRKGVDVMDSKTIEKIKENYKKMEKNYVNQASVYKGYKQD